MQMIPNFATELETRMTMELQEDINTLVEWSNKWQMNFNVDKCSVMHIEGMLFFIPSMKHVQSTVADNRSTAESGNNQHQRANMSNMSNQQLPTTDQQLNLGIINTKELKSQKQTEESCKTANRARGFVARNFRYKNKELVLPLYKSWVRPHLEHAVQFWSPHHW